MEKNIIIRLNNKLLSKKGIELISNDDIVPYYAEGEKDGVKYRVIAGLGATGNPFTTSGWYIYCNDRLVVEANIDELTGWKVSSVQFHPNFAMFRGILFLDSDDTLKLPLTTTKKGVDSTSEIFKFVRFFMDEGKNHVLSFLKGVANLENPTEYRKLLYETNDKASVIQLKRESFSDRAPRSFIPPELDEDSIRKKKTTTRISFVKGKKLAEQVKAHNKSKNFTELGSNIFDYYVKMEELDNE